MILAASSRGDERLVSQLIDQAKANGLQLTGEGGVLAQLATVSLPCVA
jgi:hypothetical protein